MVSKLIIALDFSNLHQARELVKQLDPATCALKVGSEMFTLFGTEFVRELVNGDYNVFLDLKFHDIPNTVAHACRAAAELGVWMINVHASGGLKMMIAARDALSSFKEKRPLLVAVTVLTSMSNNDLQESGVEVSVESQVNRLARLTHQAGLDGIVCSAHEAAAIKALYGADFLTVTPGIRLAEDKADDQSRIMTPVQAIRLGSDFLVIGRPITQAQNPKQVLASIIESIK